MIPLATVRPDHPKSVLWSTFAMVLIQKARDVPRALQDWTKNVLALKFGSVPYFLGRTVFDFVYRPPRMDITTFPFGTYSQLKLCFSR